MKTTTIIGFTLICACASLPAAEVTSIHKLSRAELEERLEGDTRAVQVQRQGLRSVISYVESRPDLFPANKTKAPGLPRREEKEIAWNTWQRFLDYILALDSIEEYHAQFYHLKGAAKEDSFLVGYAAMLAKYRAAMEFIERAEHNPELDKVLNDPVPELGLPAGTYAKLKFKYLNVAIGTDFAAREVLLKTFSGDRQPELRKSIRSDADYIWHAGKGHGEVLTAKNALKVVQNGAQSAWMPVQHGVSEWMGDTKVYRRNRSLISEAQIKQVQAKLLPGDVFLERREWYMSNIGLPGFWSHAALYLGTPEERRAFFDDADTQAWVKKQGEVSSDLEALLQTRYPKAYEASLKPQEGGHAVRLMEAISEGVSFTTLEHSADCDSLVVLRPKLTKAERAQALVRAFHYAGRPYDFNFDFATDSELVCTELVYKAYEPAAGFRGLTFPLVEMLGRKVTPANEIARQFNAQCGTPEEQFEFVIFLDGHERHSKAVEASLAAFRVSWIRPKWHVLVQK